MRTFDPERFAVVETVGRNLLLRGNIPLTEENEFAYEHISNCLTQRIGQDLSEYDLIDVCLIDNVGEAHMFDPEVKAFGIDPAMYPPSFWPPWQQPDWQYGALLGKGTIGGHSISLEMPRNQPIGNGDIIWWPIEAPNGAPIEPFLKEPGWNLNGLVGRIKELLKSPPERPLALYVHCTLGADRTGAAIASYLVSTHGLTGAQAIEEVTQGTPSKAPPSPAYQQLILDYAAQFGR